MNIIGRIGRHSGVSTSDISTFTGCYIAYKSDSRAVAFREIVLDKAKGHSWHCTMYNSITENQHIQCSQVTQTLVVGLVCKSAPQMIRHFSLIIIVHWVLNTSSLFGAKLTKKLYNFRIMNKI